MTAPFLLFFKFCFLLGFNPEVCRSMFNQLMWTGIKKETERIADNSVAAVCSAKIAETQKKNMLKGLKRPIILSVEYLNSRHDSEIRPMFIERRTH